MRILKVRFYCTISVLLLLTNTVGFAADEPKKDPIKSPSDSVSLDSKGKPERNFYDVLEDLYSDFEYDLKNGQVLGLKDISFKNIAVSENIPPSFKSHLELTLTERIMRHTKTKVIQCLPCRAKKTALNGDQVTITSPESNPSELSRLAKIAGIENYVDVAFSYQPSAMVLSLYITQPDGGSVVWSRSYNSETTRASAFRRGVDFTQVDDARKLNEYMPSLQYRLGFLYLFEPNVDPTSPGTKTATTGCIGVAYRMVERYDNRKKEVGFELNYLRTSSSIVSSSSSTSSSLTSTTTNLYGPINLTLVFLHSWNLIGGEENFNLIRGNVFAGVGGTYTSGYIGGLFRTGYEWRLAKHWAVNLMLGYRPTSTAFLSTSKTGEIGGMEYGLGVNILF